ncbi:methylation-associated defense system restriction endonuclease subunit S MAD5 [Autumnicola edwardsiae]|uniref:Restriction endonuclease subunit S n=1 Tax=Autumnicola edwardsiae TaxID=3075594 RepID=A0ABU3CU56_9FLAO|nr:restriction endonuclease subunit S [Zunongwangia sp. F297]MDT0649899.1 restriction endonuclease subunit S [Zunongwangia sp. F297]
MITLKVKHNWLKESGQRLDASYYLSDGPLTNIKLEKSPYPLTSLSKETIEIFKGNIFKRVYVHNPDTGYPFMTASDMMKSDLNSGKFVSKKYTDIANLMVDENWILTSRSGTLGNTVYTNKGFKNFLVTDDLIRIIPNNNKVNGGFLYAYLTSKYGNGLLTQSSYGGVVKHIEPHHIKNLPIPVFPIKEQLAIDNLIKQASRLREEANGLIQKSNELFNSENNLNYDNDLLDISENTIQLGYKIKSSNLSAISLKARNYSFRANKIIEYWATKKGVVLNNFLKEPFTMGARASFKRITSLNFKGKDLISQGDIHKQNPKKFKQVRAKREITINDTAQRGSLIMPSAGTLGENEIFTRPLLVRNNFEDKLLSEVIGKFQCKSEIDAAYLFTALSSTAGFRILRAKVYGTNLMYPNWEFIKNLSVPIASSEIKSKIGQMVLDAFDKRGLADKKENEAIDLVEKEIEQWQK